MTLTARRTLLYVVIVALAGIVLCVAVANTAHAAPASPADTCDPAYTGPQCCACEPSGGAAEPAPLPRIYLPAVMYTPRMSAEFTPLQPVPTVTPDPPVSGDVQ